MRLAALAALLCGCSATEVDVTVNLPGIVSGSLPSSGILQLHVPNDGNYVKDWPLDHSTGTERFVYRSGVSSGPLELQLGFSGLGAGDVLACGSGTAMLEHGASVPLTVELLSQDCTVQPPIEMGTLTDLGVPDLGVPDLAPDLAPGADFSIGATILTDSFDRAMPIGPAWSYDKQLGGTVDIDSFAFRGSGSLHLRLDGSYDGGYPNVNLTRVGLSLPSPVWIRAWVSLNSNFGAYQPISLFILTDGSANSITFGENQLHPSVGGVGETGFVDVPTSTGVLQTRPGWSCLEWMLKSGSSGRVQAWLDGNLQFDMPESFGPTTFVQLSLNLDSGEVTAAQPLDLWIDELAVADHQVGCH